MTAPSDPPTLMSLLGSAPNLTGGMESSEYVRMLRANDEERARLTGHEGPYCRCELCVIVAAALALKRQSCDI